MMYRYQLLFLIGISLSFSVKDFERSQFPLRSGDIIILPPTIQDDSFLYLIDSNSLETSKSGLKITETNVANLISTLIGGPVVNSADTLEESLVPSAHNLFNKARANLVVFVNSLGSDTLEKLSLKLFQEKGQKIGIQRVAYPQDTIASLTTLMTGHTPSTHGIVHKKWESKGEKTAYSPEAILRIFNVNDQITQTFEGQPLIISASLDSQMASTLGVNPRNKIGNNFALYWNKESASFENIYNGNIPGLNISASQLLKIFEKDEKIKSTFDLNKMEDFYFLAEIEFLRNMAKQLEQNEKYVPLTMDNVPDLFSFSFSTLNAIKQNNGEDSSKFIAAVQLLDETLLEVYHKLSSIYSGKMSLEVVFLGTPAYEKMAQNKELKNRVFSLLKDSVNKDTFETYFPSIYITRSGSQDLCRRVREEIANEVICTNHLSYVPSVKELVRQVSPVAPTDDLDAATTFQTVLWISIILFIAAYAAVYSICQMELPADSILYRTPKQHTS